MAGENVNTHPTDVHHVDGEGVRRSRLTKEEVFAYALASLGFPQVAVEANDMQFGIFLQEALDVYNNWRPVEKFDVLDSVTSAVNRYDMTQLQMPFGRGIVHVSIGTKENFFSPISGVFALGIPHPISHLSPDQYDLALRYIKTARNVYSSAMHWEWEEPVLWLYAPTGYGGPFVAAYTYYQDTSGPEEIRQTDYSWFKKYFYNLVRRAVGEARGKFSQIPGPQGHSLNGDKMVDKAEEALEKLEKELESKSYADTPPLGPGGDF